MRRFMPVHFIALIMVSLASGAVSAQNLLQNGDFEAGLDGWSVWSAPNTGFWSASWIHDNDCDIWVPTNGCPFEGLISHSQKKGSDAPNAHGGLYQQVAVVDGAEYRLEGWWSGGVTGSETANASWWEVVVYDGAVTAAEIDQAPGASDALIAKREVGSLAEGEVFQFQWESFGDTFTAQSDTVTIALKVGSFGTRDAAGYHDVLSLEQVIEPPAALAVPTLSWTSLVLLLVLLGGIAVVQLRQK
jgi:hypothetical protein